MVKIIIRYLILFIVVGCSSQKVMVTIKYQTTKTSQKYYLDVPKEYSFKEYAVTIESENQYIYDDSSFIYISNFKNIPNYNNIIGLGDSLAQYRFQDKKLTFELNQSLDSTIRELLPDTFELSGIQENGLFWKDIKIGDISVGYVNVPKEKKHTFDESINSIRKTKRIRK